QDREGTAERRLRGRARLDHHELARARLVCDLGVPELQQHVRTLERLALQQGSLPGNGHSADHNRRRGFPGRLSRMLRRTPVSAPVAGSLLAANLVALTLYLNPERTVSSDALPLLMALFLPYAVALGLAFALLALAGSAFRWWPRAFGPMVEGYPWLFSFCFLAVLATAWLYWFNLLSYRHSIPVPALRRLRASRLRFAVAGPVLPGLGLAALAFPLRPRALSAAVAVLAPATTLIVPLALHPAAQPRSAPVPVATDSVTPVRRVIL